MRLTPQQAAAFIEGAQAVSRLQVVFYVRQSKHGISGGAGGDHAVEVELSRDLKTVRIHCPDKGVGVVTVSVAEFARDILPKWPARLAPASQCTGRAVPDLQTNLLYALVHYAVEPSERARRSIRAMVDDYLLGQPWHRQDRINVGFSARPAHKFWQQQKHVGANDEVVWSCRYGTTKAGVIATGLTLLEVQQSLPRCCTVHTAAAASPGFFYVDNLPDTVKGELVVYPQSVYFHGDVTCPKQAETILNDSRFGPVAAGKFLFWQSSQGVAVSVLRAGASKRSLVVHHETAAHERVDTAMREQAALQNHAGDTKRARSGVQTASLGLAAGVVGDNYRTIVVLPWSASVFHDGNCRLSMHGMHTLLSTGGRGNSQNHIVVVSGVMYTTYETLASVMTDHVTKTLIDASGRMVNTDAFARGAPELLARLKTVAAKRRKQKAARIAKAGVALPPCIMTTFYPEKGDRWTFHTRSTAGLSVNRLARMLDVAPDELFDEALVERAWAQTRSPNSVQHLLQAARHSGASSFTYGCKDSDVCPHQGNSHKCTRAMGRAAPASNTIVACATAAILPST